eukprot:COSAG04_NODE_6743_length_1265_cov_1.168096_2_plen_141_part_00
MNREAGTAAAAAETNTPAVLGTFSIRRSHPHPHPLGPCTEDVLIDATANIPDCWARRADHVSTWSGRHFLELCMAMEAAMGDAKPPALADYPAQLGSVQSWASYMYGVSRGRASNQATRRGRKHKPCGPATVGAGPWDRP